MNKRLSRWLFSGLMALSMPAVAPSGAYAWLGGGYARWYGWAGPLYGGFGGYPGARYVSGYGGYGWGGGPGWGVWGCDCWSGCGVDMTVVPSPAQSQGQQTPTPGNSVIMNVTVPPEAIVYINGRATSSLGGQRRFRSDNLKPGAYPYEIRAEIERDGQKLVLSKTVELRTGNAESVAFDFNQPDAVASKPAAPRSEMLTSLTLRVPQGAKVFLGDNPTRATGTVRRFATRLKPGQRYSDYKVRVEAQVDGKLQTREQVISLAAGEKRDLNFDFSAGSDPLVAANGSR
ncbi:MAG TPA: TIGR03000 domain-containing protein [Pirellulales bacterium]|nr:TIGR03000 domain-containing protein [Pirellulales bacterium]